MLDVRKFPFEPFVELLRAVAEPTRLRLLVLLADADLTVSELTTILGQSQPRISRHLKLLSEAGLITRHQEGSWAFFRASDDPAALPVMRALVGWIDPSDPILSRDAQRLDEVRARRSERAADYFARNAAQWDRIRWLHVSDDEIEAALLKALGRRRIDTLLDVGTGTGRMLEVLAPRVERAVGIDSSREMLAVARAKIDEAKIANAFVRLGDVYHLPIERGGFDLVVIHQVLHYLDEPGRAVREAAAALAPGGRLAIIDFAPHDLEFLRSEYAHLRLGFSNDALKSYVDAAGLKVASLVHLESKAADAAGLTVTIVIAEDTRRLVADDDRVETSIAS
ncbi:metalloregulator ArsR/SmtB family transcription factor [Jiella sp. MQZ9-1]|uniref:Metalloregulator ArsR/SmtB family transcription factor n=1 Tax=Jiella flava TaxID=2816857 RepID=A0A939JX31_9HYPH|nr:metalloregulator ArsR/SmtB family transcription factor [Jiella flava]MBO0663637.1 metalloregulator ArsR/SmtB family transcription factor [Jiella flava]MCD2472212.1 metalloregulator ArsR/SmtB family transcription factor [Jiella flava]